MADLWTPPTRTPIASRFDGRVAIVTGGTHGIGLAIGLELLREGASLVVSALPGDEADGRAAYAAAGFTPTFVFGDLALESFCSDLVARAIEAHGSVHLLVNNAFSFISRGADATRGDWERCFSVGPYAFATLTALVAPAMERAGGGAIVNVSSISASIAQPNRWTYNCAKGAVAQLTRCSALDLAPKGIRVNSVSPGWTWTREVDRFCGGDRASRALEWGEFAMLRRLAHTVEIAAPVLFLLSRDASFITGTDLPVDGGYRGLGPEGLGEEASR